MRTDVRNAFRRIRQMVATLSLVAPLAACGAHWDMSWDESGRRSRSAGVYRGYGGQPCGSGDALSAAIVVGVLGIAWGIEELCEAIGGH